MYKPWGTTKPSAGSSTNKKSSGKDDDDDKKPKTPSVPTPQWTFQPSPYDQVPQYAGVDNPWLRVPGGAQDMPINMPAPPMPTPPPVTPPPTTPTTPTTGSGGHHGGGHHGGSGSGGKYGGSRSGSRHKGSGSNPYGQWGQLFRDLSAYANSGHSSVPQNFMGTLQGMFPNYPWNSSN